MAQEIERKYLLTGDGWKSLAEGIHYRQGYLSTVKERTVRVRTIGAKGYLTIKGVTVGISRLEFEYEIPIDDANELLEELCERPIIEKHRYKISYGGLVWEVDEFHGVNEGLVMAEVELESADQVIEKPTWVGEEVSGDPRYFNANLVDNPYKNW
ncbi:MAG: CYTH domain-containing protein [Thermoanaerobaculales bacterium]|nr:CYTH domain-containing protein [Thermoanaerobaculales bacterium]